MVIRLLLNNIKASKKTFTLCKCYATECFISLWSLLCSYKLQVVMKKKTWKKRSNPRKANYKLSLVSTYRQNRTKSSSKIQTGYLFCYSVISAEVLKQHITSVMCPYTTARCFVLRGANLHWFQPHQAVCWEWENWQNSAFAAMSKSLLNREPLAFRVDCHLQCASIKVSFSAYLQGERQDSSVLVNLLSQGFAGKPHHQVLPCYKAADIC